MTSPPPLPPPECTHGLGVHRAAIGACCWGSRSEGPKRGTAPLVHHYRYLHTRWCCTFGTGKSPRYMCGLRWLVWEGSGTVGVLGPLTHSSMTFWSSTIIFRGYLGYHTLDCHSRVCGTAPLRHMCGSTGQTHSMSPSFHLA